MKNAYGYTEYATKAQARKAVEALGYVHTGSGESGDGGWGSREYFENPTAERWESGISKDTANISKVGRVWLAAVNHKAI